MAYSKDYIPTTDERQFAYAELKAWLLKLGKKDLNKVAFILGDKSFTPSQLVKEVEKNRDYGNLIIQLITNKRSLEESLKKEGKI